MRLPSMMRLPSIYHGWSPSYTGRSLQLILGLYNIIPIRYYRTGIQLVKNKKIQRASYYIKKGLRSIIFPFELLAKGDRRGSNREQNRSLTIHYKTKVKSIKDPFCYDLKDCLLPRLPSTIDGNRVCCSSIDNLTTHQTIIIRSPAHYHNDHDHPLQNLSRHNLHRLTYVTRHVGKHALPHCRTPPVSYISVSVVQHSRQS